MRIRSKFIMLVASILFFAGANMASAARFYLDPASASITSTCEVAVNIMIDTEGQPAAGGDAFLLYDPAKLEIIDQNAAVPGVQIREGDTFQLYAYNKADPATGTIRLGAVNVLGTFNGVGNYGSVVMKAKSGATSADLTFDYTPGASKDSNITDIFSNDFLTSVAGGTYTFVTKAFCGTDSQPPAVDTLNPAAGATGVPLNANIKFDIFDILSGVDLDSVTVDVNGVVYKKGNAGFAYTGAAARYAITIDPTSDFLANSPVIVKINGKDKDGNVMTTYQYSFNQPVLDNASPYVTGASPSAGAKNIPLNSNIVFHVKDDGTGVDINTVFVKVDGVVYKLGDSGFSYSGNPGDYFITIDPISDFLAGTPVSVSINATDLGENVMGTVSYSFNHPNIDSEPPFVTSPSPFPGDRGISTDTNVSFHVRDSFSGVNIDSVVVDINGTVYTNGNPAFSFSGSPDDYVIVLDPVSGLPANVEITVRINAADVTGNAMSTYTYRFNKPAICGDGYVEEDLGEQCEPPGNGSCSEDCTLLACEVVVGEPVCGNKIVEEGEQCEPPGLGLCSLECILIPVEEAKEEEVLISREDLPEDIQNELEVLEKDEDEDGLPDVIEKIYGTNLLTGDSDGDGISDIEEILDYGTSPNDNEVVDMRTRVVNWKDGDVTSSRSLFIKGVSFAEKNVKVFANIAGGSSFFLGETTSDAENKFALISEIGLEEGEYFLQAKSYDNNGQVIDESLPIKIIVDFGRVVPPPKIEMIDTVHVIEDRRTVIFNQQPLVFGTSVPDSQVFITFESSIFSSTILSDSLSGFFSLFAPRPFEFGNHQLTAYAVTSDGIASGPVQVPFEVKESLLLKLRSFSYWWVLMILGLVLLGYFFYNRFIDEDHWEDGDHCDRNDEKKGRVKDKYGSNND